MATDRTTYRARIGEKLGRRYYVTSTTTGTSTVNEIVDSKRTEAREEWQGAQIYFPAATAPKTALVRGGSGSAGRLFLDTDLGSIPASGATYELVKGFTLADFDEAINYALRKSWPHLFDPLDDDTTHVETTGTIKIALAATSKRIVQVRRQIKNTTPVRWKVLTEGYHYTLRPSGTNLAYEALYDPDTGTKLHFMGAKVATLGAADTDTSELPLEVVVAGALFWLYDKGTNPDEANLAQRFEAEAARWSAIFEDEKRTFRMRLPTRKAEIPRLDVKNQGDTVV